VEKTIKRDLIRRIYDRLGRAIPVRDVRSAVDVTVEEVASALVQDVPVTVKNFGTLSPYQYHGHAAKHVGTGRTIEVKAFRTVKLNAAEAFLKLLLERKERFEK
jgi:nucleoid DNA-binding protein